MVRRGCRCDRDGDERVGARFGRTSRSTFSIGQERIDDDDVVFAGGTGTNLTLAFCGPLPAGLSGRPQRLLGRQLEIRPAAYHLGWDWSAAPKSGPPGIELEEISMNWTAPVVTEVCAGMEVTAYLSAEM
jgi:coenzyme PQQ precursor peptide PqqA